MRLLLDANLSPELGSALSVAGFDVETLQRFKDGSLCTAADEDVLVAASDEGRALLTFDVTSMTLLFPDWGHAERDHAGVIMLRRDESRRSQIGKVARRMVVLRDRNHGVAWANRVIYLPPV
jgi:predicted nuclease of predicted toxin-antitoxin system